MITIDLSLRSTGYCVWNKGDLVSYGIINTDKTDTIFERVVYISTTINKLIIKYKVKEVLIEAPAFSARGSQTYNLMRGHFYVVANIVNNLKLNVIQVPITTIKKQFTGNGRAKKDEIMKHMPPDVLKMFEKDYVVSRGLTDLCDAYALGAIQFKEK